MPGVAFPLVGPVGDGSPPSPVLCFAKTAALPISGRFARRSLPDTLPASARSWSPFRARGPVEAPDHARAFGRPVPQSGHVGKEIGGRDRNTARAISSTFHRIPTQMPFQAVFMRGGAGPACMDDLVVDRWASDGEGRSPLDFPFLHNVLSYNHSQNNPSNINRLRVYH